MEDKVKEAVKKEQIVDGMNAAAGVLPKGKANTSEAGPANDAGNENPKDDAAEQPLKAVKGSSASGEGSVASGFGSDTRIPEFTSGDTISVHYIIREGNKERVQVFQGTVLQHKGTGITRTFTVRKVSGGIGVERIFPLHSPYISRIEVNKQGRVRRSKIFYMRKRKGKSAKIEEKREK